MRLLTFLGCLGNAECSPWKSYKNRKLAGVFVTASDDFFFVCLGKKIVCAIPVRVMKDQY